MRTASLLITDLNQDGTAEVWLMYRLVCRGDVNSSAQEIILYEDSRKYVLRGTTHMDSGGHVMGGIYSLHAAFRQHAAPLWQQRDAARRITWLLTQITDRMRINFRFSCAALLGTAGLGLTNCQDPDHPAASHPAATATRAVPPPALVEQRLGATNFYLALPPGFALKATEGGDFLVYYFAPADTTVRADFSGGLYLGSQPQGDEADSTAGCQTRRAAVAVLGHPATFTIHRCATGYTLTSVFDSRSGRTWDGQANAFGEAKSAAGLRQLLAIFATLRRQPTSAKPAASTN